MNKALKALKDANPRLFTQFMDLLAEDFGIGGDMSAGTLTCPNCQSEFQVALNSTSAQVAQPRQARTRKGPARVGRRRNWNPKPKSLFNLLVTMAKIRKTTTGGVSAEFNKTMRSKIKGLKPAEVREIKIKWLQDEIAKSRSKAA
jgi:hypothetical protein